MRGKDASEGPDGFAYDENMWDDLSALVLDLQKSLADEKKKSAYWQEKARLRGDTT